MLLESADLAGADLHNAHMPGADLGSADLKSAHLTGADLDFDPDSPPKAIPGIYSAKNLQLVKFHDQPAGLVKLRGAFKDLGMRTQESQLTCAIRRSELSRKNSDGHYLHSWPERVINAVLFDWTCQYACHQSDPYLLSRFSLFSSP